MILSISVFCVTPGGTYGPVSCEPRNFDYNLKMAVDDVKTMMPEYKLDDMELHIEAAYSGECSFKLTPEQIKEICNLGIGLSINCWDEEP